MIRATLTFALLLLALSVTVWAQRNSTSSDKTNGTKNVEGKIAEINVIKLVLANEHGAQREFKLNDKTKFRLLSKKGVKRDAISPGLWARITFREADLTVTIVQEAVKKFVE